jgi:cyclopropane fatty-acyl-phospholipid synthase-like methyltransferase
MVFDQLKFDNFRNLRRDAYKILVNNKKNSFFDYGLGYFYQSIECINLTGLRNTKKRIIDLNLKKLTENQTVLDIGSNIGAISIELDSNFKHFDNIEYNNSLNLVGKFISKSLYKDNISFISDDFIKYNFKKKYNLVLSLANHTTFDGGISDSEIYFDKVNDLLLTGGVLILESHHPKYENVSKFNKIVNSLKNRFTIIKSGKYHFKNFYDDGRIFHILRKNDLSKKI